MNKPPFEQIVLAHGPMVLRVCRAVLGSGEAEDAWSETFLAALRAYPDLDDRANVAAWLVTIAHRKAVDAGRAANRRPTPMASLPERATGIGQPEDWDGDLSAALAGLPDKQRTVVAYHHLGGLPYAEVAAIVGGSTDAARRAAADGVAALRAALRPRPPGDAGPVRADKVADRVRTRRGACSPRAGEETCSARTAAGTQRMRATEETER